MHDKTPRWIYDMHSFDLDEFFTGLAPFIKFPDFLIVWLHFSISKFLSSDFHLACNTFFCVCARFSLFWGTVSGRLCARYVNMSFWPRDIFYRCINCKCVWNMLVMRLDFMWCNHTYIAQRWREREKKTNKANENCSKSFFYPRICQ